MATVTSIGETAFYACTKLKNIEIPEDVTQIGMCAFEYCVNLKEITIRSEKLKKVDLDALNKIDKNAVIKVPKGKRKAYKKLFIPRTGYKKTMKIEEI